MGLTQHKRLKHFASYVKEIEQAVTKCRNTAWEEEIYNIARSEKEILENTDAPIRNINQQLNSRFPHRSTNQISCLRKRDRYKAIFRGIAREPSTSDESFNMDNSNFINSLLDHEYDFSMVSSNHETTNNGLADLSVHQNSALDNFVSSSPPLVCGFNRAIFNNFPSGDMGIIRGLMLLDINVAEFFFILYLLQLLIMCIWILILNLIIFLTCIKAILTLNFISDFSDFIIDLFGLDITFHDIDFYNFNAVKVFNILKDNLRIDRCDNLSRRKRRIKEYAAFQHKFITNRSLAVSELFDGKNELGDINVNEFTGFWCNVEGLGCY